MLGKQAERGAKFWDEWYEHVEEIEREWICSVEDVVQMIPRNLLQSASNILEIGCGNSSLTEIIYDHVPHNDAQFVAVDISSVAVEKLNSRCCSNSRTRITAIVADATMLPTDLCADNKFHIVLDKGTSDTLQFRARNKESKSLLQRLFSEVYRVLAPDGVYVIVTPKCRIRYLHSAGDWLKIEKFPILGCKSMTLVRSEWMDDIDYETKHPWIHLCYKKDISQELSNSPSMKSKRKRKICFNYEKTMTCARGDACPFKHEIVKTALTLSS